jgi:outer membrane protein assembly factor BamD (BamD/ComL family)
MKFGLLKILGILILLGLNFNFFAEDTEVKTDNESFKKYYNSALEKFEAKEYDEAGELALQAEEVALDSVMKANSLQLAIDSYRAGGMLYKEFNAVEKMIIRYRNYTDSVRQIDRLFEIGNLYFAGEREPSFWALRWIPWLHGEDKTEELYTRALAQGPFAENSHLARMRLAVFLIENKKNDEALKHLREIVKIENNDPNFRYAYLLLAEQLMFLAHKGDGDNFFAQEAIEICDKFKLKYPNASENDMVDKWLLKIKDLQAKRLYDMSIFYKKSGKQEAAIRYANELISKYPDSIHAEKAEKLLVKMDNKYIPKSVSPEVESRLQSYESFRMADEEKKLLIHPSESGNKLLLPVYELHLPKK